MSELHTPEYKKEAIEESRKKLLTAKLHLSETAHHLFTAMNLYCYYDESLHPQAVEARNHLQKVGELIDKLMKVEV